MTILKLKKEGITINITNKKKIKYYKNLIDKEAIQRCTYKIINTK